MFNSNAKHNSIKWFTLVELIIVITVLIILSTISAISFFWYTAKSRDSSKLLMLSKIEKTMYINKELSKRFPLPDDIYLTWGISLLKDNLFSVGFLWKNSSNFLKISNVTIDNLTNKPFVYWLTNDNNYFQLAVNLENNDYSYFNLNNDTNNSSNNVKITWNFKWILKFKWTDSKKYIWALPSLILAEENIYSKTGVFVTESVNKLINPSSEQSINIYWTWILIPDVIENYMYNEFKQDLWTDVPLSYLANLISWDNYLEISDNNNNIFCPPNYVFVKWNSNFKYSDWTYWNFCVAKYEMSHEKFDWFQTTSDAWNTIEFNNTYSIQSKEGYYPIVSLTQTQAIQSCKKLWSRYNLITNSQWMTIAHDLELVWNNWSTGEVFNWVFKTGNSWRSDTLCPNRVWWNTETRNIWTKTWPWVNEDCNWYRKLTLSTWWEIWDFIWNVSELVNSNNNLNDNNPIINNSFCNSSWEWHDSGIDFSSNCINYFWPSSSSLISNWVYKWMWSILKSPNENTILIRGWIANMPEDNWLYYTNLKHNDAYNFYWTWFRCVYIP